MSADEMPMTGNTIVVVAIGTEPVIGAAATDANVAAKLQNIEQEKVCYITCIFSKSCTVPA